MNNTEQLISEYFRAFNAHSADELFAILHEDVVHIINEDATEYGLGAFKKFKQHMDDCYLETITDLCIMVNGNRGAAEFTCSGEYLKTDGDLPKAKGQKYSIPAAAFFEIDDQKITRITSYYSLKGWVEAINAAS
jgi:steroid delta-isomerase-like uncharacterized protein